MIASTKLEYVRSFDGLRALAVSLVLINHGSYALFPGGFLGVDLFFIISGYLISSMLWAEYDEHGGISLKNFYARRILRLYPALLICIILAIILWSHTTLSETASMPLATFAALYYLANIVDEHVMGSLNHLWSLSVEEHFYLFWPPIILMTAKRSNRNRIIFLICLIVIATIIRIAASFHDGVWRHGIWTIDPYSFTLCRIDCILIGALLYPLGRATRSYLLPDTKFAEKILLFFCFAFILYCCFTLRFADAWWQRGGFIATNCACVFIVIAALRNSLHPIFESKAMVWLGRRSYGIYIYHMPIYLVLEPLRIHHDNLNFILVLILRIALSIGIAALSYEFIEKPILRYKKIFQSRPRSSAPAQMTA